MLDVLLNVTALLLLSGLGIYVVISCRPLRHQPIMRRVLIAGLLAGAAVLSCYSHGFPHDIAHSAQAAGPMIMAGFVGGPLGALLAGGIGALEHSLVSGNPVDLAGFVLLPLLGAALGYWRYRLICVTLTVPLGLALVGLAAAGEIAVILALSGGQDIDAMLSGVFAAGSAAATVAVVAASMHAARSFRKLAAFEEHMQLAANVARIGAWEWYVRDNKCTWNDGMHALYGTDPLQDDITPETLLAMVHPDDRQRLHLSHEVASLGAAPCRDEFRVIRKDGSVRRITSALINRHDGKGNLVRISGIHMDITDLRAAEADLGAAETRLSRVIENIPGALVSVHVGEDDSLTTQFRNRYCERLLGISENNRAHGDALDRLVHGDDRDGLRKAILAACKARGPFAHTWRMRTLGGQDLWIEGYGKARTRPGGALQLDMFLFDISDMVEAQQAVTEQRTRAERAERLDSIGKLSGGIAHDFNNLLAIIIGNLEILKEELSNHPEGQAYVRESLDAAGRGADLVRNILSFARRAPLDPGPQKVADLLHRVEGWVARVMPANIDVTVNASDVTSHLLADAPGTENALVNLVLNARDAMPEGGALSISARSVTVPDAAPSPPSGAILPPAPGAYVVIDVTDTGHGITSADAKQMFDPFFTTRAEDGGGGTGLGLATVLGFMQQSHGGLTVRSKVDHGTTVSLFFPVAPAAPQTVDAVDKPHTVPAPTGLRILLAEDEMQVALVLVRALEKAGHMVIPARSGDEAARIYENSPRFDVLVTDVVMPGSLQGPDLARLLRGKDPSLPVVFLSGYAPDTVPLDDAMLQEDQFLMKPVVRGHLLDAVERAITAKGTRTAAE